MNKKVIKHLLSLIFRYNILLNRGPNINELHNDTMLDKEVIMQLLQKMIKEKLITEDLRMTDKGRKLIRVGLIGGVFDILHVGHIETLKVAKEKVDVLVVVIARNKTVRKFKGRDVVMDENDRLRLVSSIKYVDLAILGSEEDFMEPVLRVDPDIIFLGYDQSLPPSLENRISKQSIVKLNIYVEKRKTSLFLDKIRKMVV